VISNDSLPIVLIASSGSSGSHLLARLLAEFEPFVTGPEANFAGDPALFGAGTFPEAALAGLLRRTVVVEPETLTNGQKYYPVPPLFCSNAEVYGIESKLVQSTMLLRLSDWGQAIRFLLGHMKATGVFPDDSVYIEHSPSAAAGAYAALRAFPALKVIHLVRDPRDAIASMARRRVGAPRFKDMAFDENLRISAYQWAVLAGFAHMAENEPGYLRVRYEDLVGAPEETLGLIVAHLGRPDAARRADGPLIAGEIGRQDGWRSSPMGEVSTASVGQHKMFFTDGDLRELEAMAFSAPGLDAPVAIRDLIERYA